MGDMNAEPSMEEILSSIKRIIAEEGEPAPPPRGRRLNRPPSLDARAFDRDEVLELSDTMAPDPVAEPVADATPALVPDAPDTDAAEEEAAAASASLPENDAAAPPRREPLLSARTAEATRGPLDALSRMVVKPETPGADTLEALVQDMLRPMLRDWLDARLPELVEEMVSREIARITGRR